MRLDPETRRLLDEVAAARRAGGASSLARDILERAARQMHAELVRAGIDRLTAYLGEHGEMADDPGEFFPDSAV
ncbi:MAG: hypothetical protein GIW94_07485 [Candidatus Eremiobacteraeota bacterium]|nr:hypothetical protein [Candidatus Eremiobacteraeota bacterium]MBC5822513.1 hypothetical protein [Candidatus Eremiobacteraeota bacterium]